MATAALAAALAAVPRAHAEPKKVFTLADCLELSESNAPQIKVAIDRVAQAHAQLDEINWIPWSQFSSSGSITPVPEIKGGTIYSDYKGDVTSGNPKSLWLRIGAEGVVPLYTFGKIEHSGKAASAFVDVVKAEGRRGRDLVRYDVRRAYFGLQLAHDGRYLLEKIIREMNAVVSRLEGDENADESEITRLKLVLLETGARLGEMSKLEAMHLGTLRLLTGVEAPKPFEIPDAPLSAPKSPLLDELVYLKSAHIHRPELKQVGAGIVARSELVEYSRSKLYPDVGLWVTAGLGTTRTIADQGNVYTSDPYNYSGGYGYALAFRWSPELLPNVARIKIAAAQLAELRNLEMYALGGVGVEVANAFGWARDAETREKYFGEGEQIARRWVVSAAASIGAGLRPDVDLFDPMRAYLNHRYWHLVAMVDVAVSRSQLALATGDDGVAP